MPAVKGKPLATIVCPLCNSFQSKRITNVEKHIVNAHDTTAQEAWNSTHGGPVLCKCGCGNVTRFLNIKDGYSSMITGHNGNLSAVYGHEKAKEISEKRRTKLLGQTGWSKGLTKETDSRVAARAIKTSIGRKRAFTEGRLSTWSKGLTKETDARLVALSQTLSEGYKDGTYVQWAAGSSEDKDERIKKKNDDLRTKYRTGQLTAWHKGKTRVNEPRFDRPWLSLDPLKGCGNVGWSNEEIEGLLQNNNQLALESIKNCRNKLSPALTVRCRTCGWTGTIALVYARTDSCPSCNPKGSVAQVQMTEFIKSMNFKTAQNVKGIISSQSELDVYIPEKLFAIEFNALYYHNEAAGKDRNYHQSKSDKCSKLGINLMHVFEDEWLNRQDTVRSMIAHRLGVTPKRVFGRKCNVTQLQPNARKQFFESNHIDGDVPAMVTFALEHGGEVVAALSIRKKFHGKKNGLSLEVARFCNKNHTNVVGGLSRLVSRAVEYARSLGARSLTTYVDTRFGGTGVGYATASFKLSSTSSPRFWWTDNHKRFNRLKFRANKAQGLTEAQVAEAAGVTRIWGCKNLVYTIEL